MHILTFDIEEWFHILDHPLTVDSRSWSRFSSRINENVDRLLCILEESTVSATFFCLGWIAERYPEIIKRIAQQGYEVASHSHYHQLAYEQTPEQFRDDLRRSLDVLGNITGYPIKTYRVPGFSLTSESLWVFDILIEEGIEIDCSVFPASRGHGGLPAFGASTPCVVVRPSGYLIELPINVIEYFGYNLVFSGGGYFRLLPYFLLKYLFARHNYVMTYFHPRDFDQGQPMLPGLSWSRRFKSYVGLRGAEAKLRRLIRECAFDDVRTAVGQIQMNSLPVVHI